MQLQFYKSLWGFESDPAGFTARVKEAGYHGIEAPLFQLKDIPVGYGLEFIGQAFPSTLDDFQSAIDEAAAMGVRLLNCQAAREDLPFAEGCRLLQGAFERAKEAGVNLAIETHRGRLLYEPKSAAAYMRDLPELRICADFSHWTCVTESMLGHYEAELKLAMSRTVHVHARVGHEQGPQVAFPFSDTRSRQLRTFTAWWQEIASKVDAEALTINPEYGPPPYMQTDAEGRPVADLWNLCLESRDYLARHLRSEQN